MTTRSVICVTTRSIQRATLFLPPALPPLLLTRTSRHIPCSKTICRPRTSYFLYGLAMSSSFWSRATLYPTSSLPRTSDFISTNNWMARWIGQCALYLEARLLYWRWRERREHDPSYRCRCVSHFHVSSVCKTKLTLTTAGVDNVGKEGKQSSFVADVSETDCHGARNCRRVFWARMLD